MLPIEILTNGLKENRRLVAEQNAVQNQLPIQQAPNQQSTGGAPSSDVASALIEALYQQPNQQQQQAQTQQAPQAQAFPVLTAKQLEGFAPPEVSDAPDSTILLGLLTRLLGG